MRVLKLGMIATLRGSLADARRTVLTRSGSDRMLKEFESGIPMMNTRGVARGIECEYSRTSAADFGRDARAKRNLD